VKPRAVVLVLVLLILSLYACHSELAPSATASSPASPAAKEVSAMVGPATSGAQSQPPPAQVDPPAPTPTLTPKAKPVRKPGTYANVDPDDDFVVAPPDKIEDCEGDLKKAGVTWQKFALAVHTEKQKSGRGLVCGAPEVVLYLKGPGKIAYNPPPVLTCEMALALASFEKLLQEEADRVLKTQVIKIDQIGTYNCREVAAFPGTVSEHSYANAIDLGTFHLKNGTSLSVYRDFDTSPSDPKKPPGVFLRNITRRAHDENIFSHVLTAFFNDVHKNHFHLDLARYRNDGTR